MITLQTRQVRLVLIASCICCGLAVGFFAAQMTGILLAPDILQTIAVTEPPALRPQALERYDNRAILKKNIFDPSAPATTEEQPEDNAGAARRLSADELKLHGTVDGGGDPFALIEVSGKTAIYRPGDQIAGAGEVVAVERNRVVLLQPDGIRAELVFSEQPPTRAATASSPAVGSGIREVGENRWQVSRDEVDKARSNLNQLLKSARMEPYIVDGRTEGFIVKMVRPKSLLAQLGMRRGDIVSRVNGVELNSPEKALQIFQQLREARNLTVDLQRGKERMTFEYEVQ